MFNLESHKEIIPYKLYTKENRERRVIPVKEFIAQYEIENPSASDYKKTIIENAQIAEALFNVESRDLSKITIDIMKYAEFYCMKDCEVLMLGMKALDQDLWKVFEENETKMMGVNQFLSISSIGYMFAKAYGCMDGVYELSGKPQDFIQRCMCGGRCMTANNEKLIVDDNIQDFDAVSLYPSAMYVMDGIPKGRPKIIASTDRKSLDEYDYYFIEIDIKSAKCKSQQEYKFPLIYKRENHK
jgi:hypothetical protein